MHKLLVQGKNFFKRNLAIPVILQIQCIGDLKDRFCFEPWSYRIRLYFTVDLYENQQEERFDYLKQQQVLILYH